MKPILAVALALLALAVLPLAAQTTPTNRTSEEETNRRFWQCELPSGAYMVGLDRICAVGMHEYLVEGGFLVTEVTIDTVGSVTARFYYGEPYRSKSEYATGQAVLDRAGKTVDELRDRAQMSQIDGMVVKNYPTTTHAKTIEFNITRKDNLAALFQSVNKAWISGKGVKFTIRKE